MAHPDFISGNFDTNFVNKNWNPDEIKEIINDDDATVAGWIAKTLMAENDQKTKICYYLNLKILVHNRNIVFCI